MTVARRSSPRAGIPVPSSQPNEFDLARVNRAIRDRARYRYVTPTVFAVDDGYLIRSPCCSRNIAPDGAEIDVARLHWRDQPPGWRLLRKDHRLDCWVEDSCHARLSDLFIRLNADPEKLFWQ